MTPSMLIFFVIVAYFENLKTLTDSLAGLKSLCYFLNTKLLQALSRDMEKKSVDYLSKGIKGSVGKKEQ